MNKYLLWISKAFGIYAPFTSQRLNTYYGGAFCTIYTIYSVFIFYLQFARRKEEVLTAIIQSFMLFFVNLIIIVRTTIFNQHFIQLQRCVDEINGMHARLSHKHAAIDKRNFGAFIITQIGYGVFVVSGYHVWGRSIQMEYYMQMFSEYIFMTILLMKWEFLHFLQGSIEVLNRHIFDTFIANRLNFSAVCAPKAVAYESQADGVHAKLNLILYLVEKHHDMVTHYNQYFGWNILFCTLIAIHYLLGFFAELVHETKDFNYSDLFSYVMQLYNIVQGVMIPIKCEHVMQQRSKTMNYLQKLLHRYDKYPGLENKMMILLQQAINTPAFTAAGFFNLSYAMLFNFMNMIITYLVVIIQFSYNNK